MKNPSRTLVNWLAIGLIVLFVWTLLAAVIVPRLRQAGTAASEDQDGTATPFPTLTVTPTWDGRATPALDPAANVMLVAPSGAVITTDQVGEIPPQTRVRISTWHFGLAGWIFQVVTLDDKLFADARLDQLMLDPAYDASMPTVPPRYFDAAYWGNCYPLILTEAIPAIGTDGLPSSEMLPAGTRVGIGSAQGTQVYVEGKGYVWVYTVTVQPQVESLDPYAPQVSGTASEDQLAPAPGAQVIEGAPTPTSAFMGDAYGSNFIMLETVGSIEQGEIVGISTGYLHCDEWVYQVIAVGNPDGAWVRANQIAYAPGVTPGAPTATYPPQPITPTYSTPLPTFTATPGGVIARTIGDPHTVLRTRPDLDGEVIAEVPPGTELIIIGRWVGYDWYLVRWNEVSTGQAWVYSGLVTVEGDITQVPALTPMP